MHFSLRVKFRGAQRFWGESVTSCLRFLAMRPKQEGQTRPFHDHPTAPASCGAGARFYYPVQFLPKFSLFKRFDFKACWAATAPHDTTLRTNPRAPSQLSTVLGG